MLYFLILLPILCTVPGTSFPQRSNPNSDGNFDFDSYLEHFTEFPSERANDPPRITHNQDYRYVPLLGERPDYVPPILQRGHFPHQNFPMRSVIKEREWHSSYQDGNFPRLGVDHPSSGFQQNSMLKHRREWPQTSQNLKMEDLGRHEAPVVVEAFVRRNGHEVKNHGHKVPIMDKPSRGKPVFVKEHPENPAMKKPVINEDHYDSPEVVEAWIRKSKPVSIGHDLKQPIGIESIKNKHEMYPEDYEEKAMEALTKKESPSHNKRHSHKRPILKHEKRPIVKKHDQKVHIKTTEFPVYPSFSEDKNYESPVVVETFTKEKFPVSPIGHGHKPIKFIPNVKKPKEKNPVLHPEWKPIVTNYPEDYEAPVVVGAWIKKELPSKEHGHKKQIEVIPVVKKHNSNMEPVGKPIVPSYPDNYDVPMVVEAWTKKEKIHKKRDHQKQIVKDKVVEPVKPSYLEDYEEPVVVEALTKKDKIHKQEKGHKKQIESNLYETNPIVEPVKSSYIKDYDEPIVVEAFTKKGTILKEHGHKKPIEIDTVENQYEKNLIVEPVKPSYPKVYEAPVVVETWTIKGSVHKEKSHKKRVEQDEKKKVWNKHGNEEIDMLVEKSIDSEYGSEKSRDYPHVHEKDGSNILSTIDKFNHKPISDKHEDSIEVEIPISKGHKVSNKPDHKKQIGEQPTKDHLAKETDNYEKLQKEHIYLENAKGSKTMKESGWLGSEEKVNKRIKRQIELDPEEDYDVPVIVEVFKKNPAEVAHPDKSAYVDDYDVPVVVEVQTKNPPGVSHEKPILVKPKEHDYEYDLPVVIESQTKNPKTSSLKTGFVKPEDYEYDYDVPVIVEAHTKKQMDTDHKKPELMKPTDHEDNYDLPTAHQTSYKRDDEYDRKILKKPPKINRDGYKDQESVEVEALTKEKGDTNKHGDKKESKEPTVDKEQIATIEKGIPIDAYSRNKREYENHQNYFPTRVDPNMKDDGYERPIHMQTNFEMDRSDINMHKSNEDYFDRDYSVAKENVIHDSFEPLGISDTEVVVDSLSINREGPEGHEIPVLDIMAVEDHENDPNAGVKVMAFNRENGDVDVINIGHEDSNHRIEDFSDSGSGVDLDERSVARSFLPMNSNAWSFMTHIQAQERQKFKRCLTPKNETGNCMPIQMCPVPNGGGTIDDFLRNVCIIDDVFIGICCPEFPVESVRVDWGQLGNANSEALIDNEQASQEPLECGSLPSSIQNEDPWPWTAPLVSTTSDRVFCGGALINEQYVLTAAHCTSRIPRNRILVRLGSPDSQTGSVEFTVVEIKRHAQYNPRTMQNDIALLKLSRRVPLGNFRRLVCIPDGDVVDNAGETAVLRWKGNSESGVESLPVISNHECQNRLGTLIGDSVLCTEPRNEETTCNADSGAPLVVNADGKYNIIGVLTWNRNDCDGRFPSVFTRISSYRRWIQNHAN